MSRVSFTRSEPGTGRLVAPVNNAFAAFVTQSTNLEAMNLAQEGLDPRIFHNDVGFFQMAGWRVGTPNVQVVAAAAWTGAALTLGGVALQLPAITAAQVPAGWALRIRAGFCAACDGAPAPGTVWGVPPTRQLDARLTYSTGGVPAVVVASHRSRSANHATIGSNAYFRLFAYAAGGIDFDWFQIETQMLGAAINYRIEGGWIYAVAFPKAV